MIIYKLACQGGHEFEGWFGDSADFDRQKLEGLLTCPVCHSKQVQRLLGGVPLTQHSPEPTAPAKPPNPVKLKAPLPGLVQTKTIKIDPVVLIKALNHHVHTHYENVGKHFYDQAVQMHEGVIPAKRIYGEVTASEQEQLDDAQIEYAIVPKLSPKFEN